MAEKSWLKKISKLKALLRDVGPLWPASTKLAGYASDGPYSCADCEYLKGRKERRVFVDDEGKGRCSQSVMIADSEVKKDSSGRPIVDIARGCCEFVHLIRNEDK